MLLNFHFKSTLVFCILDKIWTLETKSSSFERKTLWLNKIKNNNNYNK